MDIIFETSEFIEKNENVLLNMFFHVLNHDFRNGFYSEKSSIRDMTGCGFSNEDYTIIAKTYYDTCPQDATYSQGQRHYQKIMNEYFDEMVAKKIKQVYSIDIDNKTHLLVDLIKILKSNEPNRDWDQDNIFILKTLDYRMQKEEDLIRESCESKTIAPNVIKLPVKKKISPEDIKKGFNEFLMVHRLGMTWDEARVLARDNFDKKMLGKKFEPYIPDTEIIACKPKM